MNLIDTHCHIDVPDFDADREEILTRCVDKGINRLVVPAIAAESWQSLSRICDSSSLLFPAFGLHPVYIDQHKDSDLDELERRIKKNRPLAVGEIGLDFFLAELDRDKQESFFERQLEIAKAAELPVILHVRKSHDAVLSRLKRIKVNGGTCHAFNGSLQQAKEYINLGFKLGFGGMLTYERSSKLRRLARELPLDAIVLETDAPDMTVASHNGERNSPEYLTECLAALATIRNEDLDYVAAKTTENAESIFSFATTVNLP